MKTILLIDDEIFCSIYKKILENTDKYTVCTANTDIDGIELAKTQQSDLILLDILMPDINAIKLYLSCCMRNGQGTFPLCL